MRRKRQQRFRQKSAESLLRPQVAHAPDSLRATMAAYLQALVVLNYSESTRDGRSKSLLVFARWCEERGLMRPAEVTRPLLERYQRHLFYLRKANGQPLSVRSQYHHLCVLKQYFRWLCRQNLVPANPASELLMPRLGMRLPRYSLSAAEVEQVLAQPDVATLDGLRDRAMLEVLWATGLRRSEVVHLGLFDINPSAGTVFVNQGKGKRDRVVPIGQRALGWVRRYLDEVRPRLVGAPDDGVLFLSSTGAAVSPDILTHLVRGYLEAAGINAVGSCHLFRHACATQMLEAGADIRFVQELLGHSKLDTTVIYTRVAISKLKAVYDATHPASRAPGDTGALDVAAGALLEELEATAELDAES